IECLIRGDRSEHSRLLVYATGGVIERVDRTAFLVSVSKRNSPQARNGDDVPVRVVEVSGERAGVGIESGNKSAGHVSDQQHIAKGAEVRRCLRDSPRLAE